MAWCIEPSRIGSFSACTAQARTLSMVRSWWRTLVLAQISAQTTGVQVGSSLAGESQWTAIGSAEMGDPQTVHCTARRTRASPDVSGRESGRLARPIFEQDRGDGVVAAADLDKEVPIPARTTQSRRPRLGVARTGRFHRFCCPDRPAFDTAW